jgi:hypothetical protein
VKHQGDDGLADCCFSLLFAPGDSIDDNHQLLSLREFERQACLLADILQNFVGIAIERSSDFLSLEAALGRVGVSVPSNPLQRVVIGPGNSLRRQYGLNSTR